MVLSTDASADYADRAYAALGAEAQKLWRQEWGQENRYHEVGLCFTAEPGKEAYVASSMENVQSLILAELEVNGPDAASSVLDSIQILNGLHDMLSVTKTGGASGTHGYLNRRSGWADADASMRFGRKKLESYHRVKFVTGTVTRLLFSATRDVVEGAVLDDGRVLRADLTVLAAGAWTPTLLDLRGRVVASGQILTYLDISDDEAEALSHTPVQLNMSTGMFVIPPPPPAKHIHYEDHMRRLYLKIARHGHGYMNYATIPNPEDPTQQPMTISVPHTNPSARTGAQPIPQEGVAACRDFLSSILDKSSPMHTRPFSFTRICHYADTPTGDFLLDYHPRYGGTLFLATGGNGHGFKFLPVIGDKIVDCIVGECPAEFKDKWCWKEAVFSEWPGDGSRGGRKGMILAEELEKGSHRI